MEKHRKYLPDFIFGGVDGLVTTFAVISSAIGASLSAPIIIILGIANLVADGFSMGASNYLSSVAENDLDNNHSKKDAFKAALVTFTAFIIIGFIPLIAFVFKFGENSFLIASILTAIAFFTIGYFKGYVTGKSKTLAAMRTLLVGVVAAIIAYGIGFFLRGLVG